jgi:alpha-ketoglutarate-dependent 2,4-dichlorophenoxyacetate dioxygenase
VGDLVIWDNRSTMHRGRSYEENKYPRELRRVTVAGTVSSFDVPVPSLQEMGDDA